MFVRSVYRLSWFTFFLWFANARVQEAPDGSVCFNNCNGHGECIDYSCHCWVGYHGDDCGTTFGNADRMLPILSSGHFNVSRKNFTQTVTRNKMLLVGFSSPNCHRCIQAELEYEKIAAELKALNVPFARANVEKMKAIAAEFGASELPSLVLFKKQRPLTYRGVHALDPVVTYVKKQQGNPVVRLKSVEEVVAFTEFQNTSAHSLTTVMVVGFFSEHEDIEEDDYDDFVEAAEELQSNEDIFFGCVTSPKVAQWFKQNKTIDRTPSMMLVSQTGERHSINLDEFYGERIGIREWVSRKAIPLVGKLTGMNFPLYEKLGIPMLMLFLDLTDELQSSAPGRIAGGKSGGILNEVLLEEFREAAKDHVDRLVFVYIDGTLHEDQMRSLGLYGGKERLPSLAFNTRDGAQIPFPEELPVNRDTLLQFCADFISGKLKSAKDTEEMAKKALQSALPINQKNRATRRARKQAPEIVRGISEQFGDGNVGDTAVVTITAATFEDRILSDEMEEKDIVLLLHAKECVSCSHFAVYFKRMAERFRDLEIPSLMIARMDVSDEAPPAHLNLMVGTLPLLVIMPAGAARTPPWTFYSGLGKVQPMMKWVHQMAGKPFDLPNLPHLTEKDREAYKTQVREREEALDKQRMEDKRAMEAEDRAKAEVLRKKRKQEREIREEGKLSIEEGELEEDSKIELLVDTDGETTAHQEQQAGDIPAGAAARADAAIDMDFSGLSDEFADFYTDSLEDSDEF